MSRLSIPTNGQLTGEMRRQAESIDATGADSTVLRVLGHRPDMIESYFKFYYPLHNGGIVDPALKEMVRLKIASLNQCLTWKKARFPSAMEKGLTEDKISRLENFRDDPAFNERERVALEFAERMALNHSSIDDDFFRRMRAHFSDPEIVEIGMAAGQYIGFGRLLMVLDLERTVCDI